MGDLEGSLHDLDALVQLRRKLGAREGEALRARAWTLIQLDRNADAISDLERALERDEARSDRSLDWSLLAWARACAGDTRAAAAGLARASELSGDEPDARALRATFEVPIAVLAGDLERAGALADDALQGFDNLLYRAEAQALFARVLSG
jgi:hypothetical protein